MRTLLLLPLLLSFVTQSQDAAGEGSPLAVLSFKWNKSRQVVENPDVSNPPPAPAMIDANKKPQRDARQNNPRGARDPNDDTLDGRSAALEKSVREARSPRSTPVDGYAYHVKVRNAGGKAVEVLFWEYEFAESAQPSNVVRRQFLCGAQIKPDREKELLAFSVAGPGDVVSAGTLADKSAPPSQEKVVINRVEYADGTIWQRKGWSYTEVRAAVARATATPWGAETCRGL